MACVRDVDAEGDVLDASADDNTMFDVVEDDVFNAKKNWTTLA